MRVDVLEQVLHTREVMSLTVWIPDAVSKCPVYGVHIFICSYANFTPLGPKIFELFMETTKVVQKNFPPTNW
jgi:hypothetical protein